MRCAVTRTVTVVALVVALLPDMSVLQCHGGIPAAKPAASWFLVVLYTHFVYDWPLDPSPSLSYAQLVTFST